MKQFKFLELKKKGTYQYATRKNAKGAVVVIPYTYRQDSPGIVFQLIKNTRPTFDKPIIEFPAGLLDVEGQSVIDAAIRELKEQTGWIGQYLELYTLFDIERKDTSSAGLSDQYIHYVPLNLLEQGEMRLDGTEKIEVLPLMDSYQIFRFIKQNKDKYYFSSRLTALFSGIFFFCPKIQIQSN